MKITKRTYKRSESCVFRKTKEEFGGLSNMASGFPLLVNDIPIPNSEALYQACRYPHKVEAQLLIIEQKNGMSSKMKSKLFLQETRPDWEEVKIDIMRWCLRVKLARNFFAFGRILESTGNYHIVESSAKDDFWGAVEVDADTLVGKNVLGRLLMELRTVYQSDDRFNLLFVKRPSIYDFKLLGKDVEDVDGASDFIRLIAAKWKDSGFSMQEKLYFLLLNS